MRRSGVGPVAARALLAGAIALTPGVGHAEADGPDHFRVTGLAEGEMLDLRAGPGAGARRLAAIPPGTDGLRNLGCAGGLSYAEWAAASAAERAAAAQRRRCRVGWKGLEGWVAARFLAEGSAPAGAEVLSSWRLVPMGEGPAGGAPAETGPGSAAGLAFLRGGRISGSTGCNRFTGAARVEAGRLVLDGPLAVTRMACPGQAAAAEARFLAVLAAAPEIAFDPLADRLELRGDGQGLVFARKSDARAG